MKALSTCERLLRRRSGAIAVAGWIASVVLMALSVTQHEPDEGRLSLLVGMFALGMTCAHLADKVTARLTQIMALFHDDVLLADDAKHRRPTPAPTLQEVLSGQPQR